MKYELAWLAFMPENRSNLDEPLLQFGPFSLQIDGTLFRDAEPIRLPPKELAILRVLVANPGQVVPLETLRKSAWNGVYVSDESLPRCVSSLRAHLGLEDCIQTVYKRGYRLQLAVHAVGQEAGFALRTSRAQEHGPMRGWRPAKLAIVPFRALQDVPQELGNEIAEAIMLRMAQTRNPVVEVLAWDSVSNLANRGLVARDIGAALEADVVLTGSVGALPRHLRVRAEMIQVSDHVQLWLEDFLIPREASPIAARHTYQRAAYRIEARIQSMQSAMPMDLPLGLGESILAPGGLAEIDRSGGSAAWRKQVLEV